MYVGNIHQWTADEPFIPAITVPWVRMLAALDYDSLTPGRHDLGEGNFMNVDVSETAPAATRNMEAHHDYMIFSSSFQGTKKSAISPFAKQVMS